MKKIFTSFSIFFLLLLFNPNNTFAHGGGLDSDGGHNCYVAQCAGTYHCHRQWGPRCFSKSKKITPAHCVDISDSYIDSFEQAKIQEALKFWGFNPGPIDGYFGPKTLSALNKFEIKAGIPKSYSQTINYKSLQYLWVLCN